MPQKAIPPAEVEQTPDHAAMRAWPTPNVSQIWVFCTQSRAPGDLLADPLRRLAPKPLAGLGADSTMALNA